MNYKHYKHLPPFKGMVLQNFPFIEEDFDAITNYQLLCKIVEYLRNVIANQLVVEENVTNLYNSYVELKNYVDNYFNTVDFQNLVNEKLDSMVEDGTLASLINNTLFNELNNNLNTVIYNKSKFSENIIEGTPQKVLFTGDSITYGQVPSSSAQVDNPYPKLIQDFINNWYEDNTLLTCLNYGIRGAISTNANNNFNTYLEQNPDVIFWAYGTNDVTQLRSNDTIINNLNDFYKSCINNNIELIVIIPAPNFINEARRQGMNRLHQALLNYCQSRGIIYVDMYEYVNNLYNSNATTHDQLQTDGTHFIEYSCFRDAIITKLLPIVYNQNNNYYNYIQIDSTPNYVKSNIGVVTVTGGVNIFNKARRITSDSGNTFKMNILVKKASYLYLNGYSNNTAGKGVFTLDGIDYTVNQYYNSTGTTSTTNIYNYKFPILLQAGLHTIELKQIIFESDTINRFYMFGFTLEENNESNSINGYRKLDEQMLAWSGTENSLTDEPLLIDYDTCNTISLLLGLYDPYFQYVDIKPPILNRNFYENDVYKIPVIWNDEIGIMTISLDHTNNQISISSTNNIPIRKIYMYNTKY